MRVFSFFSKRMPSLTIPSHYKSKFRGCIIGAIVADCMAARFGRAPEPFALVSSRLEPASLRNQIPRNGGRFLFPYGVDSLMLFATGRVVAAAMQERSSIRDHQGLESALLVELRETLSRENERASSIKWGVGTRHVLENSVSVSEAQLRSNCGITRALIAGLVDFQNLAEPLCRATHVHETAIAGSRAIASAVRTGVIDSRPMQACDMSDISAVYERTVDSAIDLASSKPYREEDEFSTEIQDRFKARFGSDASSQCSVAAAVFSVHRTMHSLPSLDASSREYQERISNLVKSGELKKGKGVSANTLGNSNRLDTASLFASLTPSIEQDLPVALATSWAISLGGDVRSNACLAGGLAGAIWGEEGIPEEWRMFSEGVEEGKKLADVLLEIFKNS